MRSRTLIWGHAGPADITNSAAHERNAVTWMYKQICLEKLLPEQPPVPRNPYVGEGRVDRR